MGIGFPSKVLITRGHEIGGVSSVAEGLREGFTELGIPVEVISPGSIFSRLSELRNPSVLKLLSTSAVFAAPFARRAICISHGVPRAHGRGWIGFMGTVASLKLANLCGGAQLVAVSSYTGIHVQTIFDVRIDDVILNPLKSVYLDAPNGAAHERCYITYVGRLDPIKNLHRLLPPICDLLDEMPALRVCIIGDGKQKAELQEAYRNNPRVEFEGNPDDATVRDWLRRTRVFVSGNTTEGLGVTYLEALSQGCAVAMPASGGGLEIALEQIGDSVHLFPLTLDRSEILSVLRRAVAYEGAPSAMVTYSAKAVASAYLRVDSQFSSDGKRIHRGN